MVTADGTVKILDFGLAKLAGTEGVTQTGTTVGTVAYMSPEQARGEEVDHRTDIWSLGVVLYEMVAGRPPFQREHGDVVVHAILRETPTALTGLRTGVPMDLERVVTRALSKAADDRYQTVADLLSELRSVARALRDGTTAGEQAVPSIAVLPFANMSADPENEFFTDGLSEDIINALGQIEGLRVAARGSAFFFKGKQVDLREVGQKLQVSSVLEGSVRKAGKRLRVTAELVNAEDGYQLWSERYDRELEDIFDIQDEIARSVVEKLKVKLLGEQQAPVVKRPTDNLEAYNLFLKGRYHLLRITGPSLEKSLECFTQALAVEPTYAQAHALTGMVQGMRAVLIFSAPQQVMPMAKEAALKALALDESVGDGHFALAASLDFYEWKWTEAEREYRRALELNPGDTLARSFYADLLGRLGRADASVAEARHAVEREPLSVFGRHILAIKLYHARRFDDAIIQAFGNIELDPTYYVFHQGLG